MMKKEKTFVAVIILVCEIFMILYFAGKIDFEVDVDHGAIDEDNDSFFSLNGSEYTPHRIRGKYYLNLNRRICHALRNSRNVLLENVITMSAISPIRNFIVSEFYTSDDETSLGDYSIVSKIRLNELLVSSNKTAFFYSTEYVNFARSISQAELIPWKRFLYHERELSNNSFDLTPQLHILSPRSSLQLRYSEAHTVRLQLCGSMRYVLLPPKDADALHLFPSFHYYAKQSQVDLLDELRQSTDFPDFHQSYFFPNFSSRAFLLSDGKISREFENNMTGQLRAKSFTLSQGEALYIPPFYSVHSLNQDEENPSIFLDVSSVSSAQLALAEADFMLLPFDEEMCREKDFRIVAAQVFLVHILSRIPSLIKSIRSFSRDLYRSRFAALQPLNSLHMQKLGKGFDCLRNNSDRHKEMRERLNPVRVQIAAQFVADKVNGLGGFTSGSEGDRLWEGVRKIWLQNYSEKLARWAMGNEEAVLFLKRCLYFNSKIQMSNAVDEIEGPSPIRLNPSQ